MVYLPVSLAPGRPYRPAVLPPVPPPNPLRRAATATPAAGAAVTTR